jgi:subtilisin family serine protease
MVVDFLRARGYDVEAFELFPSTVADLPKKAILELNKAQLENLSTIYWGGIEIQPQLDSVVETIRAPTIWNYGGGYTGEGVTIAVVDASVINPNITHRALQGKIIAANVDEPTDWHAAAVAGVIAGDHPSYPQYRGIAYGSDSLVSVDMDNYWESIESGLNWAIDQGAFAINCSFCTEGSRHSELDKSGNLSFNLT